MSGILNVQKYIIDRYFKKFLNFQLIWFVMANVNTGKNLSKDN